ncbi:hypothetical protein ANAEL_04418 [Anaerolineales bacterium]|nr:hypothetical protein ANAEL_04418 [Anaerolineales bacterium]
MPQESAFVMLEVLAMETSRLLLYSVIALIVLLIFYVTLTAEPSQDFPTNIIHLLFRH